MTPSCIVLALAVCLPVLLARPSNRALWEFRNIILCSMPDSWPIIDYADYGCYCGKGGHGTPVDDLDRCCQTHDHCYNAAMKDKACWPIIDNPYTYPYHYECDKAAKSVTCLNTNNQCAMFICECDRKAAMCFSKAKYNKENDHIPRGRCNQPETK